MRLLDPRRRPERLERAERLVDRVAGGTLLPRAPPDDAESEQRAGSAEGVSRRPVLGDGIPEEGLGPTDVPVGGGHEPATVRHVCGHPLAPDASGVRVPGVENASGVVEPAELEQQLHVVRSPPADARLAPPELGGPLVGPVEPLQGSYGISPPEPDEPENRQMLRRRGSELLLGERNRMLGALSCKIQPAPVERDDGAREMVLRDLEPVLNRDVMSGLRMPGCDLPPSAPELDPGQAPERAGTPRFVLLAPLSVLAFEQCARLVPPGRDGKRVHKGQRRFLHEPFAAEGARELLDQHRQVVRGPRVTGEPAENRLHGAGTCNEDLVVELARKLECGAGVVDLRLERPGPREPAVDERLKPRTGGRFDQSFFEEVSGSTDAFELSEEDQGLGAPRADPSPGQELPRDRACARPFTGGSMGASGHERSTTAIVVCS